MKKVNYLVNITDCTDIAANELFAVLTHETADMDNVSVQPITPISPEFSVINANFAVRLMADSYSNGSVLMTTINAEKVRPMNVIGRTKKNDIIFIGRNMGSFDWLTRDFGCSELYDLSRYNAGKFESFAGKLVTAKIASKAAKGIQLSELGDKIDPEGIVRMKIDDGTVVHIDNFGMMKFTGSLGKVASGDKFEVKINETIITATYEPRLMSLETNEWAFFPGSSFGLYELGQARGMGAKNLEINVGDKLEWRKLKS